jgi:hypothetical protein
MEWLGMRCGLSRGSAWFQNDRGAKEGELPAVIISPRRARNLSWKPREPKLYGESNRSKVFDLLRASRIIGTTFYERLF